MPYSVPALTLLMLLSVSTSLRDVEYARPNGESLFFDAQIPPGDGPFPAAILVHGGGWVRGDRRTEMEPLFEPLTRAGIAWFTVDYRLAKDPISFGTAYLDVETAVQYIVSHAAEYKVDPTRVALIGESAGGQLAAMAALNPNLPIKTVIAMYAPTDLVALTKEAGLIPANIRQQLADGPWGALVQARLAQLSPISNLRRGLPPFLFIHGTSDPLVPFEQSRNMCDRMKSLGNTCEVYAVTGAGHGMRHWKNDAYQPEMIRWLNAKL